MVNEGYYKQFGVVGSQSINMELEACEVVLRDQPNRGRFVDQIKKFKLDLVVSEELISFAFRYLMKAAL